MKNQKTDVVNDFYLKFSNDHGMGQRLEEARLLLQLRIKDYQLNRKKWCQVLHIGNQAYAGIISGKKPIPMAVWPSLHELGFSLDWFVSGKGSVLNKSNELKTEKRSKANASSKTILFEGAPYPDFIYQDGKRVDLEEYVKNQIQKLVSH